jgi:ubiquinone/menaquinone biosynthesis C-methylase UbiE
MEDPERDAWQKPDEVLRALAVKPGQTVCDIGTGPGYFALRFARAGAHVFAVDVEPKMVEALRDRVAKAHLDVTPVLGLPDDPLLPDGSCDLVLVVDTFHHFPDGVKYLERLGRALKPGGRVANIDFHKRELPVGPPVEHKVAREDFLKAATAAGYTLAKEETFLPYQYFIILKKR